jgi:hypothetical protein
MGRILSEVEGRKVVVVEVGVEQEGIRCFQ